MTELKNRIAVVTGGSQGLGRGIALELARAGAKLAITHLNTPIDRENAQSVITEINSLDNKVIAVPLDVTDQSSVESCVQQVLDHFGRIDILVNNAGVMQKGSGIAGTEVDKEEQDRQKFCNPSFSILRWKRSKSSGVIYEKKPGFFAFSVCFGLWQCYSRRE